MTELSDIYNTRARVMAILNRFVRPEDKDLTDFELIKAVWRRWDRDRAAALIDPAE